MLQAIFRKGYIDNHRGTAANPGLVERSMGGCGTGRGEWLQDFLDFDQLREALAVTSTTNFSILVRRAGGSTHARNIQTKECLPGPSHLSA